ncbi:MAG: hypothetical protein WC516_08370 [Patescibacteria group bacterium]
MIFNFPVAPPVIAAIFELIEVILIGNIKPAGKHFPFACQIAIGEEPGLNHISVVDISK